MAVDKAKFAGLAQLFGFKVNEDAIEELVTNEYDMAKPDNWADMSPEDQKAWEEKHMVKNVKTPLPAPKQVDPAPAPAPAGDNLVWLNSLITEMGGREAFKGLLLGAVEAVEVMQQNQDREKSELVARLVANARGTLTEEDLKDFDIPILRTMEKAIQPQNVDYSFLGQRTVVTNKSDIAEMPDIFNPTTWKEA